MAFSEAVKKRVRQRAKLRCCICREEGVEIHHIVPMAQGGSDDEDNAAPLCPNHHDRLDSNPDKRKFIREARDSWYRECEQQSEVLYNTREIKRILEHLYARSREGTPWQSKLVPRSQIDSLRYSFTRPEFVHPLILRELLGHISDAYETITGVDVLTANQSNRFFGTFNVSTQGSKTCVRWRAWEQSLQSDSIEHGCSFSYSHIATSESGIELVECHDCGGGSGVFGRVGLFSWERDLGLDGCINEASASKERLILKLLGSISLGDRYGGEITYENGVLVIGPDEGWFRRGDAAAGRFPVD